MNFAIVAAATATAAAPAVAAATPAAALEHRKLTDAAQQFEGMLLQEMLKPMKEHGFAQDEGEDDGDKDGGGFGDTLSSFGTEAMATAIAKGGGLGIARQVIEQVEREKVSHAAAAGATKSQVFQNKTATVLKFRRMSPMS
jgi:peptidoglycan hydrolase FlgJ